MKYLGVYDEDDVICHGDRDEDALVHLGYNDEDDNVHLGEYEGDQVMPNDQLPRTPPVGLAV